MSGRRGNIEEGEEKREGEVGGALEIVRNASEYEEE